MKDGPKVLSKVIQVLDVLSASNSRGVTVGEVSRDLRCDKSTASRLLASMARHGLLVSDPGESRYRLGFKLLSLSQAMLDQLDIRQIAYPFLEQLWTVTGETVSLHLRTGKRQVCIEALDSKRPIRLHTQQGESFPLHSSASGKAILAYLSETERKDYVFGERLDSLTTQTIIDPQRLWSELEAVRARGFATSIQERTLGELAISSPVLDYSQFSVASISISGTLALSTLGDFYHHADTLRQTANKVSVRLGFRLVAEPLAPNNA